MVIFPLPLSHLGRTFQIHHGCHRETRVLIEKDLEIKGRKKRMGSSESTKRLTVERTGEDGTPGIVKVSDSFNAI